MDTFRGVLIFVILYFINFGITKISTHEMSAFTVMLELACMEAIKGTVSRYKRIFSNGSWMRIPNI